MGRWEAATCYREKVEALPVLSQLTLILMDTDIMEDWLNDRLAFVHALT